MDILAVVVVGIVAFAALIVVANCVDYWTNIAHRAGEHMHSTTKYGCCTPDTDQVPTMGTEKA